MPQQTRTQQQKNCLKRCSLRSPCRGYITRASCEVEYRLPEACLTLIGRNILSANHVKYLGVIFDKRITWRLHIGMTEAKVFRTFIGIYSLLKSVRLSANIKLNLHKALIRAVMTYACRAWELAADTYLLKLQRLQNKILRTISNFF
jgi:hypothetical protein